MLKIGVAGIRGVVGEFLTPSLACEFGRAFGTYVGRGRVIVGRDTRRSGPMLQHAVHCGLLAAGCEVIDVGVLPTPTIQIYAGATRARGGIALTASHNPAPYNALKLFNARGLFFNSYERTELIDLYHQSSFYEASNDQIRCVLQEREAPKRLHIKRVLAQVDVEAIRRRKFRVAVDCVNGAAAVMTPSFLREELGCDVFAINDEPDGRFPREPEPVPEALGALAELVRTERCDVGFAHDPDGDRLAVVDEKGSVLENDDLLALAVDAALEHLPGDVAVNLTTTAAVDDIARKRGRTVYRTPVGEANVVEMLEAVGAAIGGEGQSGGIIFPHVHLCRDSYSGMALFLGRLAATGSSMSQLADALPRYQRRFGKVPYRHGRLGQVMQTLERNYPDGQVDRTDGLKVSWPDRWIHVRASNTEPLLRYSAEAPTADQADALAADLQSLLA
jgi:phosphomannomutase